MVMTAPTPMMMPSMVSAARSLLARMRLEGDRDGLAEQHGYRPAGVAGRVVPPLAAWWLPHARQPAAGHGLRSGS